MSHLRPEDRVQRHRRSDCKKGRHQYGDSQNIGAGILRRVCEVCGMVNIDLTGTDGIAAPLIPRKTRLTSMTAQESEAT